MTFIDKNRNQGTDNEILSIDQIGICKLGKTKMRTFYYLLLLLELSEFKPDLNRFND